MNFLDWLFGAVSPTFTGVLPDQRPDTEKQKDWLHEERQLAGAPNPFAGAKIVDSPYYYENQNRTFSCVPHGVGLALAIERKADTGQYVRIAQMFPYRLRINYPGPGSVLSNIFDLYKAQGAPLFTTLPTPQTEDQANAVVLNTQEYNEAALFKGLDYYTIGVPNDINTIANIAAQGHGVAILIYGQSDEWGIDYPHVIYNSLTRSEADIVHCVCVLPNSGFIENGTKYVTVQDSAWFGAKKLRYLSEDFVRQRVFGGGYWDKVATVGGGPKPHYTFTKVLKVGATGPEVKAMQQLLISEQLLPSDCCTGLFGGKTLAAVHAFQNKYAADILLPLSLNAPTDTWGAACIAKANVLCQ